MVNVSSEAKNSQSEEKRKDLTTRRLRVVEQRYGEKTLELAYHAAFPLTITSDLLYCLRENFVPDAPWYAVADVLLSGLCSPIGYDLYEMEDETRDDLIKKLDKERLHKLADFMAQYILNRFSQEKNDYRREWIAMSYVMAKGEKVKRIREQLQGLLEKPEYRQDLVKWKKIEKKYKDVLSEEGFEPLLLKETRPIPLELFPEVATWNIDKLILALNEARKKDNKRKMSETYEYYLYGVLVGYSPKDIANKLGLNVGDIKGIRTAFSKEINPYVREILDYPDDLENNMNWQRACVLLEKAGYKNSFLRSEGFEPLLLKRTQQTPNEEKQTIAQVMGIELKTLEFEVAYFTEEDEPEEELKSFEFETVTVNARGEVIKREQSQAYYFIEYLGEEAGKPAELGIEMVAIPGGTFVMGSPEDELRHNKSESPQHKVTVQPFFMGKYPVTQAQWRRVAQLPQVDRKLNREPSRFRGDNFPVEGVSWEEAKEFCLRLSNYTGRTYTLPSEAEWEYACRAVNSYQLSVNSGATPRRRQTQGNAHQESEELTVEEWNEQYNQPFHFGETISTDLANYRGTDEKSGGKVYPGNYGRGLKGIYREETTPVGYFKVANNFGLSDMHGNVWEWCEDDWHENYQDAPNDGSAWLSGNSSNKVARGGSWVDNPALCRSAIRGDGTRVGRDDDVGFRVVCVASRTT